MKVDYSKLDRAFNPKIVAVVGDRKDDNYTWLNAEKYFKGKLYSVQVSAESIKGIEEMGIKNYTSLLDIPEPIDLVIVAVPRNVAPKILEDCITKNVAAAHFFTAGFTESETEEGKKLDRQIIERAREANFHLIGPNCMGIFNPKIGLKQMRDQYEGVTGQVGFISQSGNHAIEVSLEAHPVSVDMNLSVSFGNGIIINAADWLEYFGQIEDNKVIGMYLEGVQEGPRFLKVLKQVAARKPVVIWKGGRTAEGGRAIASHTASLAVSMTIWNTAMKQCGAISVINRDELIDTLRALICLKPVFGDRVGIAGGSGGQSVAIADALSEAGLKIPTLTKKSYEELASFYKIAGGGYGNPIDTGNANRFEMRRIFDILEKDENVDILVLIVGLVSRWMTKEQLNNLGDMLIETRAKTHKPVVCVTPVSTLDGLQRGQEITKRLHDNGVPVFLTHERAGTALKHALDYYRFKQITSKS